MGADASLPVAGLGACARLLGCRKCLLAVPAARLPPRWEGQLPRGHLDLWP